MPENHPLRLQLNEELHARPPEALAPPERVSGLVLASDGTAGPLERERVVALCARFGHPIDPPKDSHFRIDLGPVRFKWEKHTEFTSYTFFLRGAFDDPFRDTAIELVPADWLASLPGKTVVATHVAIHPLPERPRTPDELAVLFDGNVLTGARIGDGAALAYADFRIHGDGFSRILIKDVSLTPRQAGRMVQRLLEIEAYLMHALLTYPIARGVMPVLAQADRELAEINAAMATARTEEEPVLLDRLTRLAADVEHTVSSTHYRITAAQAYYGLVRRRIEELRELRLEGIQNFGEFTERRMAPAMNTCDAAFRLQESLSQRVGRASELLRTRVDITLERQNQSILGAMDRRARLQLRLQETVEGLSVAAITYYVVGLVGYIAKAAKAAGAAVNTDLVTGIAIPVVAIIVALGVRQIRKAVQREHA